MKSRTLAAVVFFSLVFSSPAFSDQPDCLKCHAKLAREKVVHAALSMGCSACHTAIDARTVPHKRANKVPKGLSAEQPDLCYGCHDKAMFTKSVVHPALSMGCTVCHSPHSSDNNFILNQPVDDLCASCHEKQSSGRHVMSGFGFGDAHPVKGRPDPARPGRELACTSCHNPHSAASRFLFANETSSPENLCLMCHKKIMVKP